MDPDSHLCLKITFSIGIVYLLKLTHIKFKKPPELPKEVHSTLYFPSG